MVKLLLLIALLSISANSLSEVEIPYRETLGAVKSHNRSNVPQPAILMLLNSGYLAPVLRDGSTAWATSVYYVSPDCNGDMFLDNNELNTSVMPGTIINAVEEKLFLVPLDADYIVKKIKAVRRLESLYTECELLESEIGLYPLIQHEATYTNWTGNSMPPLEWILSKKAKINSEETSTTNFTTKNCAQGCETSFIGNGSCQMECFVAACFYDGGDCEKEGLEKPVAANECAAECAFDLISDGICDPPCNVLACNFDGGDCDIDPNQAGDSESFFSIFRDEMNKKENSAPNN